MAKKAAVIEIQGRVNCQIHGLDPEHLRVLYQRFAVKHPKAHFMPKFQLGGWDGKIRFFKGNGETSQCFLKDIVPRLISWEYKIDVVHSYAAPTKWNKISVSKIDKNYLADKGITWPNGSPIQLYDHQVNVVNALIAENAALADAATGAGKTLICAAMSHIFNDDDIPCMIIVPSQDLVEQTARNLRDFGVDVGQYGGGVKEVDHTTIVSTWQTLKNTPNMLLNYGAIIVDETHIDKNESIISDLLDNYSDNATFVYGVTGTIPKEELDRINLERTIGPVVVTVTAKELMKAGVLSTVEIDMVKIEEDLTDMYAKYMDNDPEEQYTYKQFKNHAFPDYQAEKKFLSGQARRMAVITEEITTAAATGKNVFVLVSDISFGKKLQKLIPDSVFLYGKDGLKKRRERYAQYADNDGLVTIANVMIASTGLDIPRIHHLFTIDIGKSFTRVIQGIGRALRTSCDKSHAYVTDVFSDLPYSRKQANQRKKYYTEADYPFTSRNRSY